MSPPGAALLLGLVLLVTASTGDVKVLNALVDGTIEMVPVFNGKADGFEWKKGTNKIIEVDFPGHPIHYVLTDRSNLNLTTGVLTIHHLQFTDSGHYTADVLVNGQYQKTTFQLAVFSSTGDVKVLNGLVGGTIEMLPVFNGEAEGFEWKKGTNKIIEVDFPGDPIHYVLKDRSNLNLTTGVLTIRHLQLTDSGHYTADVLVNGQYQKTTFQLAVFPALNKPTVSCNETNKDVVVRCHHDPDPPTYEWYEAGNLITSSSHPNYKLADHNRNLTVGHSDRESLKSLECVVRNTVTENRSSLPETCFSKGSRRHWILGLIAALVLISLISVILFGLFGPENNSCLHRLFDPLRKRIRGYHIPAQNAQECNSGRGSKSEDQQCDGINTYRSVNEENRSSREPKHADSVPNYPSAPLQPDRTEGDGSADDKMDAPESPPTPSKPNQNETESKMQIPFVDDPQSPPSKETLNSKES